MTIPVKTLASGFSLPEYGLGTWGMGGWQRYDPDNDDQADIQAIQTAVEAGITHIDTAEIYAAGHAEIFVGQAIKGYDRAKFFLASKVSGDHLSYDQVWRACERSLKRLDTEYLDLYLIHWYNSEFPLKNTIRAMNKLVDDGLVKWIGVSNFNTPHLKKTQELSSHPIVCNQVHYSLECRQPEIEGLLKYCQENDVMLAAWRPVGKGKFASAPTPVPELATKYGKTPIQIALNWLVSQPNVVTISKTRSTEHLKENLGSVGWQMKPTDIDKLRREYPDQKKVSDAVALG